MKRKTILEPDEEENIQKRRKITENVKVASYENFISQISKFESQGQFYKSIKLHVEFLTSEQSPILHYFSYTSLKNILKSSCNTDMLKKFEKKEKSFIHQICQAWIYSDTLGQYNEAIDLLNKAIYQLESIGNLNAAKAFCYFSRGRLVTAFDQKRDDYTKSIDLFPMVFCLNNRGFMWKECPKEEFTLKLALNDFSNSLQLYPTYKTALINRSEVLRLLNEESWSKEDEIKSNQVYSF